MTPGAPLIRRLIAGAGIVSAFTGVAFVAGFFVQVVLARRLSVADFGLFAFAWMIVQFFHNLTNLHADKFIIVESEGSETVFSTGVTLELITATVVTLGLLAGAPLIVGFLGSETDPNYVRVLALTCLAIPFSRVRAIYERRLEFTRARLPRLLSELLGAVLAIAATSMNAGVWALVVWRVTPPVIEIVMLWAVAPMRFQIGIDRQVAMDVARFGLPLVATSLLGYFYWNFDYYIVQNLLGTDALGIYWLGFQMGHYLLQARASWMTVILPGYAKLDTGDQQRTGYVLMTAGAALAYGLPAALFIVMGDPLVVWLFGEKWLPATAVIQIFLVVVLLRGSNFWEPIMLIHKKSNYLLQASCVNAAVIVGLGFPATRYYGVEGMASVVLIAVVYTTLFSLYRVRSVLGELSVFQLCLRIVAVPAVVSAGWLVSGGSDWLRTGVHPIVGCLCVLASYAVVTYLVHRKAIREWRPGAGAVVPAP
jgi:O-antigen/teichoic acid export membrane protein